MRRPLAVTDAQQATAAHTLLHPRDTGDIQGIIGPLARDHIGGQGPPHRIEHRLPHFALGHSPGEHPCYGQTDRPPLGVTLA